MKSSSAFAMPKEDALQPNAPHSNPNGKSTMENASPTPNFPIQIPVLHRLRQMLDLNLPRIIQVCNRSGNL